MDHVSFKIRRGEIFGFLGSNGCGKTTTMRMLTGLLPATGGHAELFGKPVDGSSMEIREHLGYMTQLFSLYGDLTVRQNLMLYARLYRIPEERVVPQVEEMMQRFQLTEIADTLPKELPLGLKQRLSLAAAVIHHPDILILDEPTSGVDPVARDLFWELIIELSRKDRVTIFITTHFMNEAERCDRISLMHAGKSYVCDAPAKIVADRKASSLEEAFIGVLEDADPAANKKSGDAIGANTSAGADAEEKPQPVWMQKIDRIFSFRRWYSCFWRETLELMRDPIRATLAIFGALILMLVMGFGINMDVENLPYAVMDRDGTLASQSYTLNLSGSSRYFTERPPVKSYQELDRRMKSGELSLVIEIPPGFGQDVDRKRSPEVSFWIDGSMPTRGETINSYVKAIHNKWLENRKKTGGKTGVSIETRYRYNPDVLSLPAMVPATIPLLTLMIPAILAALSVVREKEMGSIINLYVTPLSRTEFLLGKQTPYLLFAILSSSLLTVMAVTIFDVPVKGSFTVLIIASIMYAAISTGMGLLASSVTRSQIAVIFLTMLGTLIPSVQLCGMTTPVETQEGMARIIGSIYPTTYMLLISRGIFNKALDFADLQFPLAVLAVMIPIILGAGVLLQKKQES